MKANSATLLLIVIVIVTTVFYYNKHKNSSELRDIVEEGLAPIKSHIGGSRIIYYDSANVDQELFATARYSIAPSNLIISSTGAENDTLLSISKDSLSTSRHAERKILASYKKTEYYYTLSVSNE